MRSTLALLAFVPATLAHFVLHYPNSLGFDDDEESQGPCGGFDITFNNTADATNATVDGFAIALTSTHPQGEWLFRATTSMEEPYNWTNLLPVVSQTSVGDFCLPDLRAPADFAGKQGVVQVIDNAADGQLYQCAVVNFVEGSNTTAGPNCKNATGLTATITTQQNFTNTSTSSATSSSASHSAAVAVAQSTGLLGVVFAVVSAVFML